LSKVYNFNLEQGSTTVVNVTYTDSAGDVIPLTNYNSRMFIKQSPTTEVVDLELHSTGSTANKSCLSQTEASGSIQIYISAADSATLTRGAYFYDLEIYTAADPYTKSDPEFVKRLLQGTIKTLYNITK